MSHALSIYVLILVLDHFTLISPHSFTLEVSRKAVYIYIFVLQGLWIFLIAYICLCMSFSPIVCKACLWSLLFVPTTAVILFAFSHAFAAIALLIITIVLTTLRCR